MSIEYVNKLNCNKKYGTITETVFFSFTNTHEVYLEWDTKNSNK